MIEKPIEMNLPNDLIDDVIDRIEKNNEDVMKKGNKTEVYYFDDNGKMVEPENATKGIIRELDEDGNLVRETFGSFVDAPKYDDFDEYIASLEREEEEKKRKQS